MFVDHSLSPHHRYGTDLVFVAPLILRLLCHHCFVSLLGLLSRHHLSAPTVFVQDLLFFSLLAFSCILNQCLFLPVAFPALPSTVALIHSSVFCVLYWMLSFGFRVVLFCWIFCLSILSGSGVFLFCSIFCLSILSGSGAGISSDIVWGSVLSS